MEQNLTDRSFIILRKRNFQPLTFQEFRAQYATTFNVMNPPERAKLMKLPIIKVSYSQKHKKQIMKVLIERDYLCDHDKHCSNEDCTKLHCLKPSDRCHLFDKDQTCNNPKCTKLHIPSKSLHARIIEIFTKTSRSSMPFSKFIVLHRTMYPHLKEHHPTNDILSTDVFVHIVKIENTEKTKEIRLVRRRRSGDKYCGIERPPSLSESIDAPHPALKIISFDTKWIDTATLIHDITNLFVLNRIKDIFIPGHSRMALVTFTAWHHAQNAVKKLNNTWLCGRKVTVSLTHNHHIIECKDEEKVPISSSRILVKSINNVLSEQRIKEWLDRIGGIHKIETCFVTCRKGSDVAYVHFKSLKVIHGILNKEKKNNYLVTFRGKQVKLMLCDDGYTDASTYYSLQMMQNNASESQNKSAINDEQKQSKRVVPMLYSIGQGLSEKSRSFPSESNHKKDDQSKNDSMQLLVMRLKSLIENTIQTQIDVESKLKVLSVIDQGFTLQHTNDDSNMENEKDGDHNSMDIDAAFGDESYTIDALKESLENMKNDKKQIQVYKQALTAFETSQSRAANKSQRELKPMGDKEIRLAKSLQSVKGEIELLEKQLALKRKEEEVIKSELEITRIQTKALRKTISEMKKKIEPIRDCLAAFDIDSDNRMLRHRSHRRTSSNHYKKRNAEMILAHKIPTEQQIHEIEESLLLQEKHMKHWLEWKEWNLEDATKWIGSLENGKFKQHLSKFNALSNISRGSILNAITDPTLQIIAISNESDRRIIIDNIALLKSRTAMMNKCAKGFVNPKLRKFQSLPHVHHRRGSVSELEKKRNNRNMSTKAYGLDDLDVQDMIRNVSQQSDKINDSCVICMDRSIAPYAIVPCGHQCLCSICKNLIRPNKHKCPMCNGAVTMVIKLFRA